MKKICFFLSFILLTHAFNPDFHGKAELDIELKQKIEERLHNGSKLCTEEERKLFNFRNLDCNFCKMKELDTETIDLFSERGFVFTNNLYEIGGHCAGISHFILKQIIEDSSLIDLSAKELLNKICSHPQFFSQSHKFSIYQSHSCINKESGLNVFYKFHAIDHFYKTILGLSPAQAIFIPPKHPDLKKVTRALIYKFLETYNHHVFLLGTAQSHKEGAHEILIVSCGNKFMLIDSNLGIFKCDNLISLSALLKKYVDNLQFLQLVAFKIPDSI